MIIFFFFFTLKAAAEILKNTPEMAAVLTHVRTNNYYLKCITSLICISDNFSIRNILWELTTENTRPEMNVGYK